MNKKMRELLARKSQHVASMRAINDAAGAAARDLTPEEAIQFDSLKAQLESTNAAIDREQLLIEAERAAGVVIPDEAQISSVDNRAADPRRGFRSFGDFARSVHAAAVSHGRNMDERLLIGAAAPSTFSSEGVGQDGGFMIPPEYSTNIFAHSLGEDSFLALCDTTEIGGNSMVFPKDETVPWGTDGVRAYWQAEAGAGTPTKAKLGLVTQRLHKMLALIPVTDELLADTNALTSYLPKKAGASIRWKTNEAILFGNGNGQPIGVFNGSASVIQAKDAAQATLTLSALNLANMIARLPPSSYGNAVWMINNNVLPALFTLTLGNYPIYLPGGGQNVGGIQSNPYGTLLGRPILVTQHAKSFSSQGDVMLMDMSYYGAITKAGGVQIDTSMHLYFDADATAFRAIFRVDGSPKITAAITPANGSTTLSPFIQLAAR